MRHIGNLPSAAQAELFRDYLYAQGIRSQVEKETEGSWMIWVEAEEQVGPSRELLDKFRSDPAAPEFARGAAGAERLRAEEQEDLKDHRRRYFTGSQVFPGRRGFGPGFLTYSLVAACVLVGIFSKLGNDERWLHALLMSVTDIGSSGFLPEVREGQVWRLFTPVLLHFGPAHLLFNMLWLFQLGSMIEGRLGHLSFALLTLGLAVGSNLAQYAWGGPIFGGMSGVVYGLFGFIWLRGKFDPASGLFIDRQNVILMMIWFVACFTGMVGPIANGAHAGGLVLGVVFGYISALMARR